jgi:pyruvate dehydrogenase E2 component (dihydrolipoamide acetyltransferase)
MTLIDIVMPNLGFDTQEARIIEWLKQPGDALRKGEVIAVIESDKANVELEAIADGVLVEHVFPADTMVSVGAVIAHLGTAGENVKQVTISASLPTTANINVSPIARRIAEENKLDLSAIAGSGAGGRIMRQDVEARLVPSNSGFSSNMLALPKVRKTAREAGVNLAQLQASGVAGQITMRDLQHYLQQADKSVASTSFIESSQSEQSQFVTDTDGVQEVSLSRMRQTIGQRLSKSMQDAPHFYVNGEFDVEDALAGLQKLLFAPRPRINDLIQYLTVQTLQIVPQLNATYQDGKLYQHSSVHLAIAVGLEDGLITPVIANAERYSLQGIMQESRALVERARAARLRIDDLHEGTFTISNLGVIKQVEQFTAVINPPQVAILAVGTVKQRPVVLYGGLHIRHTVKLTLSGDHRVVDGLTLGRFMAAFQTQLDHFNGNQ